MIPVSLMQRFGRLPWRDRLMLMEATLCLAAAAIAVAILPFRHVARWASRRGRRAIPSADARRAAADGVRWAVQACARRVPWRALCFEQGLAAQFMLRRRGVPAILNYGAAPDAQNGLAAHVWVKDGAVDIVGGEVAARFAVLATFPPDSAAVEAGTRTTSAPQDDASATARPPGEAVRVLGRFARTFAGSVPGRTQAGAALLVLAAGLTEGVGLALLAPLVALIGDGKTLAGPITDALTRVLGVVGLPLSLPVLIAIFVGLMTCRTILVRGRDVALARLRSDFVERLRTRLYEAITRAAWPFIAQQRLSNLTKALTTDVETVAHGTQVFLQVPALAVVALITLIVAVALAPLLTVAVVACGCLIAVLVWYRRGDVYQSGREFAAAYRAAFDEMSDCLAALKLAKSHNAEERHRLRFEAATARQRDHLLAFAQRQAESRMLLQLGAAVALGLFVYVGATFANLAVAELLVLIVIFARLMPLLGELQQAPQVIVHMLPVFDDLSALIHRCEAACEQTPVSGSDRLALRDEIRLADVRFRYGDGDGEYVLDGVDLGIPAGTVVAVAGASGAGKSTLADLMMGLIVPDSGSVLVDGEPLAHARLAAWRRSVAYVPQDNFLFNQTVRANLAWMSPEATEADLLQALAIAGADKLVAALPAGLDTVIGERGSRLSGGERQRLVIARALLRRPTLLILDEATSALDEESERAVWGVVERLRGAMTVVIIAHRFSTIRQADLIAVLDQGRIAQLGPWHTLVADARGTFGRQYRDAAAGRS